MDRLREAMATHVMKGAIPCALTLVARRGRVVHLAAAGWKDIEAREKLTEDTLFRIYSMTKPITSAAMMVLYEEKRFRLTDPVASYLPEFRDLEVLVGGTADDPETVPARPMTIEHLLTHTSGIVYDDPAPPELGKMYARADPFNAGSLPEFIRRLARLPLASQPGTSWHYGASSDVLGRIVEVLSGESLDRFLAERVFAPLGMVDTGFHVPAEKAGRLAACYRAKRGGGIELQEAARGSPYLDPRIVPFGGHGLVSTAADFLRFGQTLADGGTCGRVRLLHPETVDLMMANHLGPEFGTRPLATLQSSLQCDPTGIGFGYGGAVIGNAAEASFHASAGTFSWGGNASTYFWIDRTAGLIGILMTQLSPSDALPLRAEMRTLTREAPSSLSEGAPLH